MNSNLIRRLAILGAFSIFGIIIIQGYWLRRAFILNDSEFHQSVTIALYEVAQKIAAFNQSELPKQNLVQRKSSNYYAVNVNNNIDANILEDYLIRSFEEKAINTDFEYAVYDCLSKELVYGSYCKMEHLDESKEKSGVLPKFEDLTYYFVVKFPSKTGFLLSNMWQNLLFSFITFLALSFLVYSMWVILKQKKLSELQKDFINNMTHEFKTPISSIKIASDYLLKDPILNQNERIKKYTEIISDQNSRLNNQVEKVLSLARLESDNFKLKKESFDIIPIIKDIIAAENIRIAPGHVGLAVDESAAIITGDKLHFTNIVYNILDNSVKYCKSIPQIAINIINNGEKMLLEIKDNGIGINKEELDKLFQKFYRVSTGNIHDVKGFGLGLFYVKNICKSHGWNVRVASEPNVGSTFTIEIPYQNG